MEFIKFVVAAILIYTTKSAGGLSANGNMFGNFARWNEPSREGSLSKKVDYKVVNASPVESPSSSSSHHTRPPHLPLVEMFPSGPPMSPPPLLKGNKLHIQVYRALMDAVVLDWTISLADKDRMKTCVVTYLAQEAKESTTIDPFMPKTRTFLLENLRPNHSYKFNMSCEDDSGHFLHSDSLEFSTRHLSSLRQNSNRDSTHSGDNNKSDYLTEMNLKLLPAISNSIQQEAALASSIADNTIIGEDPIKVSTSSLSRSYYTKKTSPHAVLGVSCAIFGAILVGITVALALRRYSQYKRSQTRLWELQTVQELERPVMPTFINLPPPYSEQPSPLYNLCASSISSGSNFCEQHLRNAIPNPLANQPCCHHHHFCENSGSDVTSSQSSHTYETLPSAPSSQTGNGCEQGSKQEVASDFSTHASILESSECKSSDQNEGNTTDTESTSAF